MSLVRRFDGHRLVRVLPGKPHPTALTDAPVELVDPALQINDLVVDQHHRDELIVDEHAEGQLSDHEGAAVFPPSRKHGHRVIVVDRQRLGGRVSIDDQVRTTRKSDIEKVLASHSRLLFSEELKAGADMTKSTDDWKTALHGAPPWLCNDVKP